ncbi:hypothetical protein SEA_ZION_24 [Corynebacterium phage Zion]|uniref:Uncharacterized protein n=5 Tax=Ceetrepovirus TaxID=2560111 RepID=A0A4Y6EKH2_9CAUD|nr:hypothetical protein FDJ12_gp24 [Corynebacterium phage Zion]YP_010099007.1 hypothetical protein KNU16_gp24 [Corynebacterium phage Kimchi1738]YP_010103226.1 hypothetical protein KNU65_gp26 [Corynebacterium phage Stickynote]ATW58657.1 hypothetical protein SEA_POTATOCHIP_24 [Corynebacterium phage PotatoChip]AYR03331.1 major tail protein [Corynebacterium phage PeteyPab]ATW58831.1 hypothetical protein SEA_ZION_24 [Corynebacterium phage Zion]AYQ98416.1 hypothetical protein KIMCHI1738_24 [Coryneb
MSYGLEQPSIIETNAGTEGAESSLPEETPTVFPETEDPLNA